jgi:uncharacterized membrane protein
MASAIARYANKLVLGIARHWLALFNLAWGLYLFLPFLAPLSMQLGYPGPARVIYALYSFTCHQLPDHSYFLFGDNPTPLMPDLTAGGMETGLNLLQQRKFIGNSELGFKVALCERDVAIYSSVLLAGLLFALLRKRLAPLSLKVYALFLIPIAIDGGTQLFGLRESNWWLRTLTGALFGVASVWLAYPYVEDAMQDIMDDINFDA